MDDLRFLHDNELEYYTRTVKSYQPNEEVVSSFQASNSCVLLGLTGVGKDTIRTGLVNSSKGVFVPVLSTTTRPPRRGEQDGVQYHFRNLEYVNFALNERRVLQVALIYQQQLSCLDYADISSLKPGQVGVSILVPQTEVHLRQLNPNLKTVFLVPPDLLSLEQRVTSSRTVSVAEVERRARDGVTELEIALTENEYFCVINDDINRATAAVAEYFITGVMDAAEDNKARSIMEDMLRQLKGES